MCRTILPLVSNKTGCCNSVPVKMCELFTMWPIHFKNVNESGGLHIFSYSLDLLSVFKQHIFTVIFLLSLSALEHADVLSTPVRKKLWKCYDPRL